MEVELEAPAELTFSVVLYTIETMSYEVELEAPAKLARCCIWDHKLKLASLLTQQ